MTEKTYIENLLSQVSSISKSYERVAKASGEHFNIFSILKIENDEVRLHSRFIASLINPKAKHGYDAEFLELFLQTMEIDSKLDFSKANVAVEKFIGRVTETTGGKLDILIQDDDSGCIMIENKVYPEEQKNQLLRYHNYNPNGVLIYLTLFGELSKQKSSDKIEYIQMSYAKDILSWLTDCKTVVVDNPILRETLTQYINLVKKITQQNTNSKMSKEIANIILNNENNFEAFNDLFSSKKALTTQVLKKNVIPVIKKVAKLNNLELSLDEEKISEIKGKWLGFHFYSALTKKYNVNITFQSNQRANDGLNNMHYGLTRVDNQTEVDKRISVKFDEIFNGLQSNHAWLGYQPFADYYNWEDLDTLKSFRFETIIFERSLGQIVKKMLSVVESLE